MSAVPTVSIVTAVFNGARHIEETLDSVAAQTLADWEHLVVDDASTDESARIVAARAERDSRLRLISQPENRGALAARNRALAAARGRYVAFLDADDLWLPDKLARQIAFMTKSGAPISHTGYRRMSVDGGRVGDVIVPPERIDYRRFLKNTAIAMSSGMVDTALVPCPQVPEGGHPSMRSDLRLWLSILRGGAVAHGLHDDLMRYRVVPGSLSSGALRSAVWVWRTYREFEGLGRGEAAWAFSNYAARAVWKRLR